MNLRTDVLSLLVMGNLFLITIFIYQERKQVSIENINYGSYGLQNKYKGKLFGKTRF